MPAFKESRRARNVILATGIVCGLGVASEEGILLTILTGNARREKSLRVGGLRGGTRASLVRTVSQVGFVM